MPTCELVDDNIWVVTELRDKDRIKMVPGANWKPRDHVWSLPVSWAACKTLRGVFGIDLDVGPNLMQWAWDEMDRRVNPSMALRLATDADHLVDYRSKSNFKLFTFQRAGAKFLAVARHALLADEMGTGKTVQTILALKTLQDQGERVFPALVVCPNSMKLTWRREVEDWWPGIKIVAIKGSAAERRKQLTENADIYVINWESVMLHSRLAPYGSVALKRCTAHGGTDSKVTDAKCEVHRKELNDIAFKSVVVDEAHRMKNPTAKQTRAIWAVGHQGSVLQRFALSGTPIANDPSDLWSIMHFLDPKEYPTKTKFVDRYALLSWNTFGGMDVIGIRPDTKDEFYSIVDPRLRRMPKDLVLPFLPAKVPIRRYAEMSAKQAKQYKSMTDNLIARLDSGLLLTTNALAQLTRLVQFSSSCADVIETVDEVTGAVEVKVRLTGPSNKVDELLNLLEDLPKDEPVVVMAASRQLIILANEALEKKKIVTRLIVGGMTEDQRQNSVDDFQEGRAQVILCTIAAGGTGLTFTRSRTIVFLQRSWSMIDNRQAVDRVHRIGSQVHESIRVVDIISPGTVEEKQLIMLRAKEERLEEILRDMKTLHDELKRLTDAGESPEHIAKLRQRIGELDGSLNATTAESHMDLRSLLRGSDG